MGTHYSLSPHAPVVPTRRHILYTELREIDLMGHAELPTNGHAADQSVRVIVPPLRRGTNPFVGRRQGLRGRK